MERKEKEMQRKREEEEEKRRRKMMNLKTVSISNTSEFRNLLNNSNKKEEVKELIVNENCCNDMNDDLEISGFENLEKIVFRKDCLRFLNSLQIRGNENLKSILVNDTDTYDGALEKVKKVIIESI